MSYVDSWLKVTVTCAEAVIPSSESLLVLAQNRLQQVGTAFCHGKLSDSSCFCVTGGEAPSVHELFAMAVSEDLSVFQHLCRVNLTFA